jgi:hypothetical protein
LLNDQSGSVLGDSTVLSWAGCHTTFMTFAYWEIDDLAVMVILPLFFKLCDFAPAFSN